MQEAPRGLASEIADELRGRILSGAMPAGSQVPTEAGLTEEFGVSRTVVREALQQLRAGGLVESFQGRGSFVLSIPAEPADGLLKQVASRRDVVDLIEYRVGVESEIAAHAATRRSETQLLAIQRALDAFASVGGEPEKAVRADFAFHLAIAQATNNRLFLGALEELGPRMILLQRTGLDENSALTSASHLATVLAEHAQVVAAIQRSDPLAAAAAMRLHLSNSKSRLRP
ncbi:FadR/GntR family transcriptional regulator [Propioniciclava flava]|uniref:GntR family transcriptional regulator n=1 Tax=Propioniciclava flava TaxID=2072026 RepID=A0A4Q2EG15_9ACTN|nr:FadR/GntR family transcriptional regulator [Propioniciclava flava]RXW31234.1 GntR family transcriptional regulator [Propioniciclava flava]